MDPCDELKSLSPHSNKNWVTAGRGEGKGEEQLTFSRSTIATFCSQKLSSPFVVLA